MQEGPPLWHVRYAALGNPQTITLADERVAERLYKVTAACKAYSDVRFWKCEGVLCTDVDCPRVRQTIDALQSGEHFVSHLCYAPLKADYSGIPPEDAELVKNAVVDLSSYTPHGKTLKDYDVDKEPYTVEDEKETKHIIHSHEYWADKK